MLSVYIGLLIAALLAPYASNWFRPMPNAAWPVCLLLIAGACFLMLARNGNVAWIGALLLLPLIRGGTLSLLGGTTAILLFGTTMWWSLTFQLSPTQTLIFVVLTLIPLLLLLFLPRTRSDGPFRLWVPVLASLLIGLAAGLPTTPFESLQPFYTGWHHWSALLAPVEAWRGGGLPYRDFPVQYGLGPTALLLASCGQNCWRGMYTVAVIANALYFAILAGSTILLTAGRKQGLRWLALVAMFFACLIWTGFPIQFAGPVLTPAVAGLRFLSIAALLFHILLAEKRQVRRDWIGHLLWLIDMFWSPEAAFFGTAIWWPYLAIRDATDTDGRIPALLALLGGAMRGAIAVLIGGTMLALLLWLISGHSLTIDAFFAYIAHPPGMLPVNWVGTIWIALAAVMLAIGLLLQQGFSSQSRSLYACLLGFLAASSYFLSRSHDNNILNLFPLLLLLLLAMLGSIDESDRGTRIFAGAFVRTMMTAMIPFIAAFNFDPWIDGARRTGLLTLGPSRMIARFTPAPNDGPTPMRRDAAMGLEYLHARHAGMVVLLDDRKLLLHSTSASTWTSVNNVANFEPLPGMIILHYVKRGAMAYRRPGWILVGPGYDAWVSAFQTAYDIRERISFGIYQAYYLAPRQSPTNERTIKLAALNLDNTKPKPEPTVRDILEHGSQCMGNCR
ncbi:hypothetical protein A0J57_24115 [Sphingobium sp. 22B]|uniref:hypothetical protein n=1 Tax=unclassified Sphingobium TaxID=2611147 RepID=UPI000784C339|nr:MULTISPECIES: hypothetical protein [unclassified Sphingobium]KXU29320.1 hypothetical protein AXW74_23625 [Sphingobium sp. AM]KYC29762.1 hypothetical protein A0J57_24115 [Sphingobium sp. 22B]OAP29298.1 hypothetical protein A8O16_24440 [Sphingobium sp. 20006FA]